MFAVTKNSEGKLRVNDITLEPTYAGQVAQAAALERMLGGQGIKVRTGDLGNLNFEAKDGNPLSVVRRSPSCVEVCIAQDRFEETPELEAKALGIRDNSMGGDFNLHELELSGMGVTRYRMGQAIQISSEKRK